MPRGFTEQEKEEIRKRLLRHGEKQFSAYGLKKTNVEELAAAAKISKGAFYLFYESKEALFMDVAEEVEQRYRHDILAALERPGPSPRARLWTAFKTAFDLVKTVPILRTFTGGDYDVLFRRVPPKKLQAHLASDRLFFETLVAHCRNSGIPIKAQPEQISSLLYPLVLASMHADDLGQSDFGGGLDLLLELVTAFCLGEVESQLPPFTDGGTEESTRT